MVHERAPLQGIVVKTIAEVGHALIQPLNGDPRILADTVPGAPLAMGEQVRVSETGKGKGKDTRNSKR